MAGSHSSVFSLVLPSTKPINGRTYPLLVASSIRTPNPSKVRQRRRNNHLRPKILKTLTKSPEPITPLIPLESPLAPPQTPEEHDLCVEVPADGASDEDFAAAIGEDAEVEGLSVSETTGASVEYNGVAGKISARSILKYGAFFVGAFVLQTIFSVWVLLDHEKQKSGDGSILLDGNGKTVRVTSANGVVRVENQLEMEKKIEEIKIMAREARRTEEMKKEEEIGDPESDDESESAVSGRRLGIQKEISARLLKLQDRVKSDMDKSALLHSIDNLGNSVKSSSGEARDNKNVNKGIGTLSFKKKLKFKSPSMKPRKNVKGFPGVRDFKASDAKSRDSATGSAGTAQENENTGTNHVKILNEDKQVNQQDMEKQENNFRRSLVDEEAKNLQNTGKNTAMARANVETGREVKSDERRNGGSLESSFGRSSREMSAQKSLRIVEENQNTCPILEKDDVLSINGNLKHGISDNSSAINRAKVEQANNDMWWLNLRYVLVILMRRSSDEGGAGGLYSLKITSEEQDQSVDSYTVAFEDHVDANNFCFLLESFFEDLDDFSAVAAPMSIQELHEAVKSHAKKVIVVKKRQLQLYAGQPLSDVEMTLCSLIQGQNVRLADSR